MKLLNNCFLNPELKNELFKLENHKRRVDDFEQLVKFYYQKKHVHWLYPKKTYPFNKKRLETYYSKYKNKKHRALIESIINNTIHINFEKFYESIHNCVNQFNKAMKNEYIIILGSNTLYGSSNKFELNIPLNKSNFWTLLLCYPSLQKKPKDIIFNFELALEYETIKYYKTKKYIKDFVFFDDCSYSGSQLFEQVIGKSQKELTLLANKFNTNIVNIKYNNVLIKTNPKKIINIHVLLPYISSYALKEMNIINKSSIFTIILYNDYIVKSYYDLLGMYNIYKIKKELELNIGMNHTPIYFDHKFADSVSTLDYLIVPGLIINKKTKVNKNIKKIDYYPFIEHCYKNKEFLKYVTSLKKNNYGFGFIRQDICIKGPYKIAYEELIKYYEKEKINNHSHY